MKQTRSLSELSRLSEYTRLYPSVSRKFYHFDHCLQVQANVIVCASLLRVHRTHMHINHTIIWLLHEISGINLAHFNDVECIV